MCHDVAIAIGRVQYLDSASLDYEEIQVGVAGVENGLSVLEAAQLGQWSQDRKVVRIKPRKGSGITRCS
jgi:hypothetical protein